MSWRSTISYLTLSRLTVSLELVGISSNSFSTVSFFFSRLRMRYLAIRLRCYRYPFYPSCTHVRSARVLGNCNTSFLFISVFIFVFVLPIAYWFYFVPFIFSRSLTRYHFCRLLPSLLLLSANALLNFVTFAFVQTYCLTRFEKLQTLLSLRQLPRFLSTVPPCSSPSICVLCYTEWFASMRYWNNFVDNMNLFDTDLCSWILANFCYIYSRSCTSTTVTVV